jgi:hypothetical protein
VEDMCQLAVLNCLQKCWWRHCCYSYCTAQLMSAQLLSRLLYLMSSMAAAADALRICSLAACCCLLQAINLVNPCAAC